VSENYIPDWLVKAAEETDAMVRKVMPIVRAAQQTVDVAHAAQQFAEDAQAAQRYTEDLRSAQQFAEEIRAAHQYLEDLRAAQAAARSWLLPARPWLLPGRELVLAMDTGMREFLAAVYQQRSVLVHAGAATAVASAPPVSVLVGDGDGARADDREASPVGVSGPSDVGVPLDAKTVFLALLWVFAILLPLKIGLLPPDDQTIIRDYLVTIGTALVIHWRVQDSRKRD
jgi:hypothetical protein